MFLSPVTIQRTTLLPSMEMTMMRLNAASHNTLIGPSLRLVLDMLLGLTNELDKKRSARRDVKPIFKMSIKPDWNYDFNFHPLSV